MENGACSFPQTLHDILIVRSLIVNQIYAHVYLEEATEVMQRALGPQEAPGQSRADLLTYSIEVGNKSIGYLK